jgi:hypothetical protein
VGQADGNRDDTGNLLGDARDVIEKVVTALRSR